MHKRRTWPLLPRKQSTMKRRRMFSVAAILCSLWLSGCARENDLTIRLDTPMKFVLSGPSTLDYFQVSGPDLDREPNPGGAGDRLRLMKDYWKVVPNGTTSQRSLDEIGSITYGQVPDGFVQVYPTDGSPPPLVEPNKYNVTISPKDGRGINMFFFIRGGKIVVEGEK